MNIDIPRSALDWLCRWVGPQPSGTVALVGAGPGDPTLISVRGAVRIAGADVILYDKLASPTLLALARPGCEKHLVAKSRGMSGSARQDRTNADLIRLARAGRRVVRLKGGDPFVFARGGEEAEALADAGIAFEVVPGATSGIAAPAFAGIALTHRRYAKTVAFLTGHNAPSHGTSGVDTAALARMDVVVIYMGHETLDAWCRQLVADGKPPETPVAVIQNGTRPDQQTVTGTLADIATKVAAADLSTPVIIVVGPVATLRDRLAWFENRPLFGKTVVNTRAHEQSLALSARLTSLGAEVLEAPTIATIAPDDSTEVDGAVRRLTDYDWLILTSATGVAALFERLAALGLDARSLAGVQIAAIGPGTARRLADHCIRPDLVPEEFVAESLAQALQQSTSLAGRRILLLRADIARDTLPEQLSAAGAVCDDVAIYRTIQPDALPSRVVEAIDAGRVDWITFTSSSTVRNFVGMLRAQRPALLRRLDQVDLASIGPITSDTLREELRPPTVQAETYTLDGLVEAIVQYESRDLGAT